MLKQGNVVYLDLHKTGSSTIAQFLKTELLAPPDHWRKHEPPRRLSKEPGDLWLMSVRDPLDYYVSLWSFGREKRKWVYQAFEESVRQSLYEPDDPPTFQRWLHHLFDAARIRETPKFEGILIAGSGPIRPQRRDRPLHAALARSGHVQPSDALAGAVISASTDAADFFERHHRVDVFIRLENLLDDLSAYRGECRVEGRCPRAAAIGRTPQSLGSRSLRALLRRRHETTGVGTRRRDLQSSLSGSHSGAKWSRPRSHPYLKYAHGNQWLQACPGSIRLQAGLDLCIHTRFPQPRRRRSQLGARLDPRDAEQHQRAL